MEKQKTEYQCKSKLPIMKYAESRAGLFGMFLLMALWFDAVIAGSVLLAGGRIGPWIFPVSLVLALIGNTLLSADRRRGIAASAIGVLFMAAAIAVCRAVYDTTFDSMGYHRSQLLAVYEQVVDAIARMTREGLYPEDLWA